MSTFIAKHPITTNPTELITMPITHNIESIENTIVNFSTQVVGSFLFACLFMRKEA